MRVQGRSSSASEPRRLSPQQCGRRGKEPPQQAQLKAAAQHSDAGARPLQQRGRTKAAVTRIEVRVTNTDNTKESGPARGTQSENRSILSDLLWLSNRNIIGEHLQAAEIRVRQSFEKEKLF
jgi:hypothetical protein